jgi:predicted aconitase with swiveling domain
VIKSVVLNPAAANGPVLVLSEPLSFWGGFDPRTGRIIDVHHPQCGKSLAGQIVLMIETRGSGTAPGGVAEAVRLGTAPLAIVTVTPDVNIAIGAAVAATLYGRTCAVIAVAPEDFDILSRERDLAIDSAGTITAASS